MNSRQELYKLIEKNVIHLTGGIFCTKINYLNNENLEKVLKFALDYKERFETKISWTKLNAYILKNCIE